MVSASIVVGLVARRATRHKMVVVVGVHGG